MFGIYIYIYIYIYVYIYIYICVYIIDNVVSVENIYIYACVYPIFCLIAKTSAIHTTSVFSWPTLQV